MNDNLTLSEYAVLPLEEKMILRLNLAAEIIEFADGELVAPGNEQVGSVASTWAVSARSQSTGSERKAPSTTVSARNEGWILIDAKGMSLNRLASIAATRLRGKHKPTFTQHSDDGDNVVIINAGKVALTGNKRLQKKHYWYTGRRGGIKNPTAKALLIGGFPERVVQKAVERVMPGGPLSRRQMKNLKVYAEAEYPHLANGIEVLNEKGLKVEVRTSTVSKSSKV